MLPVRICLPFNRLRTEPLRSKKRFIVFLVSPYKWHVNFICGSVRFTSFSSFFAIFYYVICSTKLFFNNKKKLFLPRHFVTDNFFVFPSTDLSDVLFFCGLSCSFYWYRAGVHIFFITFYSDFWKARWRYSECAIKNGPLQTQQYQLCFIFLLLFFLHIKWERGVFWDFRVGSDAA